MAIRLQNTPPAVEANASLEELERYFWNDDDQEGAAMLSNTTSEWISYDPEDAGTSLASGESALHIGYVREDRLEAVVSYVAVAPGKVAVAALVSPELDQDVEQIRAAADFHVIDECPDALAYHLFDSSGIDVEVVPTIQFQVEQFVDAA